MLAQRLRELEGAGVVQRRTLAPPAASQVYELTDWGRELEPVVLALGRWGSRAPFPPGDARLGPTRSCSRSRRCSTRPPPTALDASYELRLGEHRFHARVAGGRLEIARGGADRPDATIETDPATLASVLWHGGRARDLTIDGDQSAVTRFLRLFPPRPPATTGGT